MIDSAPAHIRNVQESIHALKVHKGTEVGEILDLPSNLVSDLDGLQEPLPPLRAFSLNHLAAA